MGAGLGRHNSLICNTWEARLAFARAHLNQDPRFWSSLLWPDETKMGVVQLHGCRLSPEEARRSIQAKEHGPNRKAWWWH